MLSINWRLEEAMVRRIGSTGTVLETLNWTVSNAGSGSAEGTADDKDSMQNPAWLAFQGS